MNKKLISFVKNMSYTLSSNLISLIISTMVILVVPKLLGVEEYGYWQLYLFYSSYVGFLHFGWNDGIYLRYGGEEYEDLDKQTFFSQFIMLLITQVIIGGIIWIAVSLFVTNSDRNFIISMIGLVLIITNVRLMFLYILQATNRIKEYAFSTILDRMIYVVLIVLFLIIGIRDYKILIFADILGKLISLFHIMYVCKDITFNSIKKFIFSTKEAFENIRVGIKLMFANIASMLIIGIVRFGIENTWDVETFGKVSLTLSISNMMMIFINAIGVIVFPILRRSNLEKLESIYSTMRDFLMVISLGILVFFYPIKEIISVWLPQYEESLVYMAILFPMFIFEGKMALLINTYLKALREEKTMLRINLMTMLFSLILTFFTTQTFKNLDLAILSIVVLLAFRSVLAEIYISKIININVKKDIIVELSLVFIFILSSWFINSWYATLIYVLFYIVYLFIKRTDIFSTSNRLKSMIKK